MEKLFKVKKIAEITGFNPITIYRHIHSGKLIAKKVGGEYRVLESNLWRYLGKEE